MQDNWKDLTKPSILQKEESTNTFARFIAKPLERGFGLTLGNALRRVLLSSLQGAAIVGVRIHGVDHEFKTIPEISEDVSEILLNLKLIEIFLEPDCEVEKYVSIDVKGPKVVTGNDILCDSSVRILNPDSIICTMASGGVFKADLLIRRGKGYQTTDMLKNSLPVGVIPIDAIFSPVKKVTFNVHDTRVGQRADFNALFIEITTNGSISPEDALAFSAKILKDQLSAFINFEDFDDEPEVIPSIQIDAKLSDSLYKSVDELELSVRAANCLENTGICYVYELVTKTEADMLKTKNFGRKTLNEIKDLLSEMGLHLGMRLEGFDPSKIREH